ncbi:MAG: Asp-tRNA(Asn)/Glu-tRNA(Gln) amidotransferase subunit GatB [Candidatus Portnoybacteria bacterium]|nr:Asp-tRNA(Asn)/Glu-tRNA(Gln) amidotransferase subunit GatB [Candidatus Portnoybacteria bacterium]
MSKKHKPTIGLEIHVELKTKTKMFCDSLNDPLEKKPNVNICPICTAQPGTLPVINKKAVDSVIKAGLALNCSINKKTWFERKNYFYPDLPKGYQISQYESPLCYEGFLSIDGREIRINRIHLEEDTGKLIHDKKGHSLVDFNRAGVPLMELVTEPDIRSAEEAKKFGQELQLIFRYLGISDANMEKGQMRVEANISLNMGTKVEVKNLNSFRAVERAIKYEVKRQEEVLKDGGEVKHETRGWNDTKQKTFSQREKEVSADYRYFPEPDLPPLDISSKDIDKIKGEISELPQERRNRLEEEYGLNKEDIEIFVVYKYLGDFFEQAISELKAWLKSGKINTDIEKLIKPSANYIMTEFPKYVDSENIVIIPENFAELIYLNFIGEISSSGTQDVLNEMFKTGEDPSHIINSKGLKQVSGEEELGEAIDNAIKKNPSAVKDYKEGKKEAVQFLVGQVMRETRGAANPKVAAKVIKEKLKA